MIFLKKNNYSRQHPVSRAARCTLVGSDDTQRLLSLGQVSADPVFMSQLSLGPLSWELGGLSSTRTSWGQRQSSVCLWLHFLPIKWRCWTWGSPLVPFSPKVLHFLMILFHILSFSYFLFPILWHVCVFLTLWVTELGHCSINPIVSMSPVEMTGNTWLPVLRAAKLGCTRMSLGFSSPNCVCH